MSKIYLPIRGEPAARDIVRRGPAHVLGFAGSPTGSSSPIGSTFWKRVMRCPREHAFYTLARLRGLRDNEALTIGYLVHHGLEVFYRTIWDWQRALEAQGYDAQKPDDYFLYGAVQQAQTNAWAALEMVSREPGYFEPLGDSRLEPTWTVVERVLSHYFERWATRDRWRIVAVEETLEFHGGINYSARLDLMVEDYDRVGLWVVEHKTTRALTRDVIEGYQLDLQILGQVWLTRRCLDLTELPPFKGVVVNLMTKHKTPQFERVEVCPSEFHLASFEASVDAWKLTEEFQAGLGYPHAFGKCTGPDRGYRRCDYFDLCHTFPLASVGAFTNEAQPAPDGFMRVEPETAAREIDFELYGE